MRLERFSTSDRPEGFVDDFCELPNRVRRDPYRHGLLPPGMCRRLQQAPLPAAKEFWLIYAGTTPIARIAANLSVSHSGVGFFGLLEAKVGEDFDAACALLLAEARDWLVARGATDVIGPVTYNTWFPYRLRLDDDVRHFEWEPVNPPEYVRAVEAAGCAILDRYTSTAFGAIERVAAELEPSLEQAKAAGFAFPVIGPGEIEGRIPDLYRMSHAAFTENFLFEPIPEGLFAEAYVGIADKGLPVIMHLAVDPGGIPVGFMYSFVDVWRDGNRREDAIVLKSLGVVPGARGHGIANALVHLAITAGIDCDVDYAISALVRSGIASEVFARKGDVLWRHDYGVWRFASGCPL